MWIFFYIFYILTSIAILPIPNLYDVFWIPKEFVFNLLGFCFISSSWMSNMQKNETFKNKWLSLILIYCSISFAWYFYIPLLTGKMGEKLIWNLWVIRPFINVLLGFWIIQTLVEYSDNLQRWVNMAKVLCWIAFGFSLYVIIQILGLDPIFNNELVKFNGNLKGMSFLGNANLTANYLAVLSPLCLIFKGLRYKIIYILCFAGILISNSALSLLAFLFGLFAYLLLNKKWKLLLLLILSTAIFVVARKLNFFSFSGRFILWGQAAEYCKNTLWVGKGLGNFATHQYKSLGQVALSPHCELLQILHDGGIIMVSLVGIYFIDLFKRIFFAKMNILLIGFICAFLVYIVVSFGSFPLRIAPLALTGIVYIAALETILIKENTNG